MRYKITFFKLEVTPSEWQNFFKSLFSYTRFLRFDITRYGRQINFFVTSSKRLEVLNNKLFPFYLTEEITDKENELLDDRDFRKRLWPLFLEFNLTSTIEKKTINNKDIKRISFSLYKYNPLKFFPGLKFYFSQSEKKLTTGGIYFRNICSYLSFDLKNAINSEIARVKPVLVSNDLNFDLFDNGILNIKNFYNQGQFSVKSFDFWRHTVVVGQSGCGKSMFIKLFIEDLFAKNLGDYTVILLDPHASLGKYLTGVGNSKIIDFKNLATNLFVNVSQPALSTELTLDLFSTVLDIKTNEHLHRVLKYALNTLYSLNIMDFSNLKYLLTDSLKRKEMLKGVADANLLNFFETEYRELYTTQYATAVLPILNLISELDFIYNISQSTDLVEEIKDRNLIYFPIEQTKLGKNITRIIGGALIQQIFTIMQAGLTNKKVILVIDEVSLVQTPSLIQILSEARKFGLTVFLSQQYLMQVSANILQSIFANTVNYFCFKLSRDDAEMVARNLNFEIDEYFLQNKNDPREVLEVAVKLLTDLNPRELVARILAGERFQSPFKAKTVDVNI